VLAAKLAALAGCAEGAGAILERASLALDVGALVHVHRLADHRGRLGEDGRRVLLLFVRELDGVFAAAPSAISKLGGILLVELVLQSGRVELVPVLVANHG